MGQSSLSYVGYPLSTGNNKSPSPPFWPFSCVREADQFRDPDLHHSEIVLLSQSKQYHEIFWIFSLSLPKDMFIDFREEGGERERKTSLNYLQYAP